MRPECFFCHIKTIERLLDKFKPEPEVAESFIHEIQEMMLRGKHVQNPQLARHIHRLARHKLNHAQLYAEEKDHANTLLLNEYDRWKQWVDKSPDPFSAAANLAVTGNIIDYGAHSVSTQLQEQIQQLVHQQFKIDQSHTLRTAVSKAKSVLYLGDNAGEIVFDRLFIETMQHPAVTFAVRGLPVINDVTFDDASQVGMDKVCKVISNGFDAPSTLLDFCSDEFIEVFKQSDLIISKGMGNFEGLMNVEHPNIYFLLIAKCKPIAGLLDVAINDKLIVKYPFSLAG